LSFFVTQVQSDWGQNDNTQIGYIVGKPSLATVALTGSYQDLTNRPATSSGVAQADWTQPDSSQPSYIGHKPVLATVSATGKFSDLVANSGQPASVTAADWNATAASGGVIPINNKPNLPAAQVNSDWNSTSGVSQILNVPTFGAAAFSNAYGDLTGKPNIIAPVNADWNSTSGLSQILHQPLLGLVATSNKFSDLSGLPTIPTLVDYSLSSSSGTTLGVLNRPSALSAFTNDAGYYKTGDSPVFGIVSASGSIDLNSGNRLSTAADLSGSIDALAGTLTYNPRGGSCTPAGASSGSVDLFGAGTSAGGRLLNLWDNVTVQGTLAVSGTTSAQAVTATTLSATGAVSTGALTAASLSTSGNASVTGTLRVSGVTTIQALNATTLTASGAVSSGALTAASVSTGGNLAVTGTAAVAGATSTGALTATSLSTIGTLSVSGSCTLAGTSAGALTASSISTTGVAAIGNNSTATGNFIVNGALGINTTSPSAPLNVVGAGVVTGAFSTGGLTASSVTISGNETIAGTLTVTGATTASAGMNVPGAQIVNFGSDQTKQTNAGQMGYQALTVGALDIVGAGTSGGNRVVKLWDNLVVAAGISTSAEIASTGSGAPYSGLLIANTGGGGSMTASGAAIDFRGYTASNSYTARIRSGDGTTGGYGGSLLFYTKQPNNADSDSLTLRMTINEVGAVSIPGTLTVNGTLTGSNGVLSRPVPTILWLYLSGTSPSYAVSTGYLINFLASANAWTTAASTNMTQATYIGSNGCFMPPVAGVYGVQFCFSGMTAEFTIAKNGVSGANGNYAVPGMLTISSSNATEGCLSCSVYLNGSSDYVSIGVYATGSAGQLNNRSTVQFTLITPL